jgi:hypothetical protein
MSPATRQPSFLQISLMVLLSPPERRCGHDLGHNRSPVLAALIELLLRGNCRRFLLGRVIEDDRPILRAEVGALAVQGGEDAQLGCRGSEEGGLTVRLSRLCSGFVFWGSPQGGIALPLSAQSRDRTSLSRSRSFRSKSRIFLPRPTPRLKIICSGCSRRTDLRNTFKSSTGTLSGSISV